MKKLLVLLLVLGTASLATAGLSLFGGDADMVTIVGADNLWAVGGYVLVQYGATDGGTLLAPVGSLSEIVAIDDADILMFFENRYGPIIEAYEVNFADAIPPFTLLANGPLATFQISAPYTSVSLLDFEGALISTVSLIPEPATMALLGLGVLVLRCKK